MRPLNYTFRGGTLALPGRIVPGDLSVVDGRFHEVGEVPKTVGQVVDARGLLIMPGVIDPQVHFREPGATHKEDIHTGSRACAAGGVTAFLEMPNTNPPTTTAEAMDAKKASAEKTSLVHYGFFVGATPENVNVQNTVENVPGIKVFMGSSTGTLLVNEDADLERIFSTGWRLIAVHAEDEARLNERKQAFAGRTDPGVHATIRDAETARIASERALLLSAKYRRRLHILHMTTADEVALLQRYKTGDGRVSAEVCPQHLVLNAPEIYERLGTRAQMNPPLRAKEHSEALWAGLHRGLIDCMATDHAPHTLEEKDRPYGEAPSGMPGVETSLPVMLDAAHRGLCSVVDVVRWMCERPARLYGIEGRGAILPGWPADLAVVDLEHTERVGARGYFTKCGWSPYDGMALTGWPMMTMVAGQIAYRDGEVFDGVRGEELRFKRS